MSNYTKVTNVNGSTSQNIRKFVPVNVLKNIKVKEDSQSDLSKINLYTWKKNKKTNVNGYQENCLKRYRTENKIWREINNYCDVEWENIEIRTVVMRNTNYLLGMAWMEQLMLGNSPKFGNSSFCQENKGLTSEAETLKKELKIRFSDVFSVSLGRCNKIKAQFKLKENVQPVFKKKNNVPFALLKQINDNIDR